MVGGDEYKEYTGKDGSTYCFPYLYGQPVQDMNDVANALEKHGYDVIRCKNPTRDQFKAALTKFESKIEELKLSGDDSLVAFFYYAGHGVQVPSPDDDTGEPNNFLICHDTTWLTQEEVDEADTIHLKIARKNRHFSKSAINLREKVVDMIRRASRCAGIEKVFSVIVLDCCRENPNLGSIIGRNVQGRGGNAGVEPTNVGVGKAAGSASLIAFSCSAGQYANNSEEGKQNGLYTGAVLESLVDPNCKVSTTFSKATSIVRRTIAEGRSTGRANYKDQEPLVVGDMPYEWEDLVWQLLKPKAI